MHSRIFEVMNVDDNLDELYRLSPDEIYERGYGRFDYVCDSNLENDIEWIKNIFESIFISKDTFETSESKRQKHFKNKFNRFKQMANDINLFEFSSCLFNGDQGMKVWNLQEILEDKSGFYIVYNGELETLDTFIRYSENEPQQWKIIRSFDYHY